MTAAGAQTAALDDLLAQADVVFLHCELTNGTRHLIDERALRRPTAVLINTARGAVVDEAALARALTEGRIAGPGSTCTRPSRCRHRIRCWRCRWSWPRRTSRRSRRAGPLPLPTPLITGASGDAVMTRTPNRRPHITASPVTSVISIAARCIQQSTLASRVVGATLAPMPARTTAPKIQVHRDSKTGVPRLTLIRSVRGRKSERTVGPRTWLSLDEAAAILERPAAVVMESIRAGFLRARRQGRRVSVTLSACQQFLREEQDDIAYLRARRKQRTYPAEEVHAELGL